MLKRLIALSIIFFSISGLAQDLVIKGYVVDEKSNPVVFSNVVLTSENTIVSGTTTLEDGSFIIENLDTGTFILKITFIGYEPFEKEIIINADTVLETIILKESVESLEGVTIVAKKPTIRRMVDRLVFNVENSTLSNDNTLDVLKHTPGVLVHDGAITIKNAAPTIYINDRRVHLSSDEVLQLLESTPANNIKSIEVITNPPAKYEAEGGAVLNIVTSKNIISGYNGSVFGNFKQGSEFPKYFFGTSHFFKTKKLNTYINYNIGPRKDYMHNNESIKFKDNSNNIISSWETDFKRTQETLNQNISVNMDYEFDNKNSMNFSSIILIAPRKNTKKTSNSTTEIFNSNGLLDSIFKTFNPRVDETFNLAFNLDYIHKFNREGETITFNVHHTNYDSSNFQNVDTDYLFPDSSLIRNNRFQTFSSQIIKLNTSQLDYTLPVDESAIFETGIKASHINSESKVMQYLFNNDVREEDFDNSDTFLYQESNLAAYLSFSKEWESWSLKTGLRAEKTDIEGNTIFTNTKSIINYFKLFPSFHVTNRINDDNEFYLSYNKRIHRPRYNQLNPFKYFLNDNTYIIGDPNLKPRIDDVLTLGYNFNKDYTFELYYRYENNPVIQFIFQDNINNQVVYKNTNTDVSYTYGLDFMTYKQISRKWNLYVLSSIYYYNNKFYAQDDSSVLLTGEQWSFYMELTNYFNLLKDGSLNANVSYVLLTPTNDGPTDTSEMHGLNIDIRKSFWNKRASLSIGVTDIFDTQNYTARTNYLNQDAFLKSRVENRLFTVGFNYKFGNFKLKNNKRQIDLDERNRLN
ncbi:TonB-dependent receptor [Seonamhaeicola sp. MEBiC1930]|uniref:outer membrane beta-barrel protein n=1 Tax=Seonamhaeicola sp. MEBiC01930 TaxID=2976768 RepID=UPI0032524E15